MLKPFTLMQRGAQTLREVQSIRYQVQQLLQVRETVQERQPSGDVVIFLHGIMAGGAVLKHLADEVEQNTRAACLLFSYSRWTWTLDELREEFRVFVDELVGDSARVILVGHSLGGMIARSYVQEVKDERMCGVVTMATPHRGTLLGKTGLPWIRDLFLPDGPAMRMLEQGEFRAQHIPHVSIAAELDQIIVPRESATALPGAVCYWIESVGHNELLYAPALLDCLCYEVGRLFVEDQEN